MVNYTGLLRGVTKLIKKSNIPIKKESIKFLARLSILPGEHLTISDLKRKLIRARMVALNDTKYASANSRFSPKGILEIRNLIGKAKNFYLTPEWKERAMKYAGMNEREAEATAKFLSSNISRYSVSTKPLVNGPLYGTTIHEAHHAAMLGHGGFEPSKLGVTDPAVISGMNKFNRHISTLGLELLTGVKPEASSKILPDKFKYASSPIEIRSRILTGLTEGYTPNEIPKYIDVFKRFVNPDVYANVAKKMLVAVPVGVGLANYTNNA